MASEASFTAKIMSARKMPDGAWECKITKTNSIPFSSLAPHQLHNLLTVKHRSLTYKIRDEGISKKPFDGITLTKQPAWVIAIYWKPRVKHFYLIDIDIWFKEMTESVRRSLTEERAKEIGVIVKI